MTTLATPTKPVPDLPRAAEAVLDPISAVAAFWSRWMEQSSLGTKALLEAVRTTGDPQQMQKRWLEAVAKSLDDLMHTPVFLQLMKQNLKLMTDLKGVQDQVVGGTAKHFGFPMAEDITGLFERLHSTEQAIVHQLKGIDERLKSVESKIGSQPGH